MPLSSLSILLAFAFTSAPEFASSDYCSSDSCNNSGLFYLIEYDCSIVVPVQLACMLPMTFFLLENLLYLGVLIFIDQPNVQFYYHFSKRIF